MFKTSTRDQQNYFSMSFSRQLNPDVNAFQRKFVNEVRRCEEMERKLRKWTGEILDVS